jgi:hypothetical protein
VAITATVAGAPGVTDQVLLTVSQRQLFLTLGTGNEIFEENPAQYRIQYIVQVTDASGNGVAGVPLSMSALSLQYYKGRRVLAVAPATGWTTQYTVPPPTPPATSPPGPGCPDEDVNRNGQLDAGEDFNTSGKIEAGNIVTVSPGTAVSGANGFLTVNVFYPQEFAYYLQVSLEARASVQGTEFAENSVFILPGSASDFSNTANAPPGFNSPFGTSNACSNPL